MMKIEAELKTVYQVTVGHDGWTSGCGYDGSDKWSETFYAETLKEIAEKMSNSKEYVLGYSNSFEMCQCEAIVYNGSIYPHGYIRIYNQYSKDNPMRDDYNRLQKELENFKDVRLAISTHHKQEQERLEILRKARDIRLKKEKEMQEFERLKNIYENKG